MAASLTGFARRRIRNGTIVGIAAALLVATAHLAETTLHDTRFVTGWILLILIAALALFEARRRIPVLPLGSASAWEQVHIYAGWFAVAVFLTHTGFGLPDGPFEVALWIPFVAVAISGTVGIWLNRILPRRMRDHGARELYDRIATRRAEIAAEAQALAIASARDTASVTIADYYQKELSVYFQRPRNALSHLTGYHGHQRRQLQQIRSLHRYVDASGRDTLERLCELVEAKDDLDYQYAAQMALRFWLFAHVPLAHALLILMVIHAVLAYAFQVGP
ncbi:hypothetical protein [Thalassobaculum salexigens]|uniref:hypothetical protein n=1 Tax=Thalassobaculum salexigens TaxID=455360 RepID=UPI00041DD1E9|nr:hypothetical protein [Thalassobaculum salexigens]